mmetsp:Transcript_2608/g.5912  ORF Transcript_2608/g.5912 Transcript_2608/m.5912 type:complete len:132 (+) Transcript_2608:1293-1688(+)
MIFCVFFCSDTLDLDANDLTGNIPSEFGNLSNLDQLDLRDNWLSGTVPMELGSLLSLGDVDLRLNELTGTVPFCHDGLKLEDLKADCDEVSCSCCTVCCLNSTINLRNQTDRANICGAVLWLKTRRMTLRR